ncbi:hypothetical protein [Nocardia sp. CC201C]|uniref:hypothetical protein n=1 Tax=Nocardia sp. CC201C TaxID=3044575 RepID=UPI0024A9B315|nr:hypothetical protein [Nocardia sp. CC201C]
MNDQSPGHLDPVSTDFGSDLAGGGHPPQPTAQRIDGGADRRADPREPPRYPLGPLIVPGIPADLADDRGHRDGQERCSAAGIESIDSQRHPRPGVRQQAVRVRAADGEPAGDMFGQRLISLDQLITNGSSVLVAGSPFSGSDERWIDIVAPTEWTRCRAVWGRLVVHRFASNSAEGDGTDVPVTEKPVSRLGATSARSSGANTP